MKRRHYENESTTLTIPRLILHLMLHDEKIQINEENINLLENQL